MFIYIFIQCPLTWDRRKLEKNTGLPVLWIPLGIFEKVMIFFYFNLLESFYLNQRIIIYFFLPKIKG